MRKMQTSAKVRSGGKKALAAALALTLAVPSALSMVGAVAPDLEAQAADVEVPDPIMTVDMTGGFQQESKSVADGGVGMTVVTGPSEYSTHEKPYDKTSQQEVLKFSEDTTNSVLYTTKQAEGDDIFANTPSDSTNDPDGKTEYVPFIENDTYKYGVTGNQPSTAYDSEMGNVLSLNGYLHIDKFVKNHNSIDDQGKQTCSEDMTKKADEKYPPYTGGYTYEVDSRGIRTQVAKDKEAEAKAVLQEEVDIESAVRIANPFATDAERAKLVEDRTKVQKDEKTNQYKWNTGVSISYWVKMPKDTRSADEKEETPYDTNLIVFQNVEKNYTYQVDDISKYEAVQGYYATHNADGSEIPGSSYTISSGYDTYYPEDYRLGEETTLEDDDGTEWHVMKSEKGEDGKWTHSYGRLMWANPNADKYVPDDPNAPKEDFWYVYSEKSDTKEGERYAVDVGGETVILRRIEGYRGDGVDVYPAADKDKDASLTDASITDDSKKSAMRYTLLRGSLQIQASGAFHFTEDDFAQEEFPLYKDNNGTIEPVTDATTGQQARLKINTRGNSQLNPRGAKYYDPEKPDVNNEYFQMRQNALLFEQNQDLSPSPVTSEAGQGQWHYMTVVIMNDAVEVYEDGEHIPVDSRTTSNLPFSANAAGKHFNNGMGYRGYGDGADYSKNGYGTPWNPDGQASDGGPSNTYARSIMEWITDPDTYLQIGGQGTGALWAGQKDVHSVDGTCLDDIKFYDVPLTEEQAIADYNDAKADKAHKAVGTLASFTFTDDKNGDVPAGMELASTNDASADVKPAVVNDGTRGHVLRLPVSSSSKTAAVKLAANPFSGKAGLTEASISYWVKSLPNEKSNSILESIVPSFVDEEKVLVHEKIQDAKKDTKSRTQLYLTLGADAYFQAACNTKVNEDLKNEYRFSIKKTWGQKYTTKASDPSYDAATKESYDNWDKLLQSMSEWHYVTMNLNDGGIQVYLDGEALSNNLTNPRNQKFSGYGPRFLDGFYDRDNDMMAQYKLSSNNQGATPLMTFLAQADTSAYLGFAFQSGMNTFEVNKGEVFVDDLTYYSGNVTAEEAKALYDTAVEAAKKEGPVAGEEIYAGTAGNGPDDSSNPTTDDKQTADVQTNADGSMTATANGVTVNIPAGALPADAKFVVTVMGTQASAATYAEADSVLNTISGLSIGKRVLYDIHFEDAGGNTLTPSAPIAVSLTPISGYTASNCSIVSISEKKLLQATVSGGSLNFSSQAMGLFAVVEAKAGEKPAGTTGGATVTNAPKSSDSGSSKAGQTGDAADVVLPILLLGAAVAAVVYIRRKQLINQ